MVTTKQIPIEGIVTDMPEINLHRRVEVIVELNGELKNTHQINIPHKDYTAGKKRDTKLVENKTAYENNLLVKCDYPQYPEVTFMRAKEAEISRCGSYFPDKKSAQSADW